MLPYEHLKYLRVFPTLRANALKYHIMPGKNKAVRICNALLQVRHIGQIHIKNTSAFDAPHMIMVLADMIEVVCAIGQFPFSDFAAFAKALQIPIHRPSANIGMAFRYFLINLICGWVAFQSSYCFQHQTTLYGTAFLHNGINLRYGIFNKTLSYLI